MNPDHLLTSLVALPRETEWVEFKHNNDAPEEIGEYLCALANSAALHGRDAGYVVCGIEDVTKRVVGTIANPRQKKIGNEELENWLAHLVSHPGLLPARLPVLGGWKGDDECNPAGTAGNRSKERGGRLADHRGNRQSCLGQAD